ncbi:Acetyl-coenzyme A carboxylase carboxyl transferase subunit beta, chloroplastic [Frankliniella fusca]|uniref:Acetyl-coenzyme A carboxylase carboxyl transferase subunit beta, chloroplastic n=1 Tax=Frankliniella fusca TaxID=407009 RepID=A0AAE1HNB0_9NEOP|nr:Acetyl-coenzyme A carboxylase carboxyl transferase subunit beta, chloroplastic [Frankliniella fusca]
MEKFTVFMSFISATYKPSNTIWPLCINCYSLIGINANINYKPVSQHYSQRTVNKKCKITIDQYNDFICHNCNTYLSTPLEDIVL